MTKTIRWVAVLLALAVFAGSGVREAGAQVKDKPAKDAKVQPKDKKVTTAAATATFELYKDRGGKFRFRLKDGEGSLLATSPTGYETKADCQKVIDAIKRDAAKAKFDDKSK